MLSLRRCSPDGNTNVTEQRAKRQLSAILACLLLTSPALAAEEFPVEKLVVQKHVQRLVHAMEFGFGSLWMLQVCDSALGRIDAKNNKITEVRIDGLLFPQTIAVGEAAVWVSDRKRKTIFKIDPNTYSVIKIIRVPALSAEGIHGSR
jgi:hypothetical protein